MKSQRTLLLLLFVIIISATGGYLLASSQSKQSSDSEDLITVVKAARNLPQGTTLELNFMRPFEIPKKYASPLIVKWTDRAAYVEQKLSADILKDDFILQNQLDSRPLASRSAITSIEVGPEDDPVSAANNYCSDKRLSPVEVKQTIAGDHANKVALACALWQTSSATAREISPEDLDRALADSDEVVRVLAMRFVNAKDPKRRSKMMDNLHDTNLDVVAQAINSNCRYPQQLSEGQTLDILNWLSKTTSKGMSQRACANLLLATYADGPAAELGLKNYLEDISGLIQKIETAGDTAMNDPQTMSDLISVGAWVGSLSERAKRLEPIAAKYIQLLQSKIPASLRSSIINALGTIASDKAQAKDILCKQLVFGDGAVDFATEKALQKLGLSKQDC